jgi:hypothetical protein
MICHVHHPDRSTSPLPFASRDQSGESMTFKLAPEHRDAWLAVFPETTNRLEVRWFGDGPMRVGLRVAPGKPAAIFVTQSTSERDTWQRVFPDPVPSTHRVNAGWSPDGTEITLALAIDPDAKPAVESATGTAPSDPAQPESDGTKALQAMSNADLLTYGAEIGAAVNPKMNKAALVAAILETKQQQG